MFGNNKDLYSGGWTEEIFNFGNDLHVFISSMAEMESGDVYVYSIDSKGNFNLISERHGIVFGN